MTKTPDGRLSEFELDQLEKDAGRLITCVGCYGSGEDRWSEGRACSRCSGLGRSVAEPEVLRLVAEVREWRKGAV